MNFLVYRDFSGFFLNYFRFLKIKIILKKAKKGGIFARDTRKAMWQRHAGPRSAYAAM